MKNIKYTNILNVVMTHTDCPLNKDYVEGLELKECFSSVYFVYEIFYIMIMFS